MLAMIPVFALLRYLFYRRFMNIRLTLPDDTHPRVDVQNAQRFALIGIALKQCGHSFVVGSAAGASSFRFKLLSHLMIINTANATIKKLMIVLMNTP